MPTDQVLDLAIVGGGIAGIVHLHYARQSGLDALVLEKHHAVGGLWRELPAWQDIQISPLDWAMGSLQVTGPTQPHILANIEAWVEHFALADGIRLDSPVRSARHTGSCWELDTPRGTVRAASYGCTGACVGSRRPASRRRSQAAFGPTRRCRQAG